MSRSFGWNKFLLMISVGAAIIVLVAFVGVRHFPQQPFERTVLNGAGAIIASPNEISEARQKVTSWEGSEVRSLLPTIGGLAVVLDDGVVLKDRSGHEERWRYLRPGSQTDASVLPGGKYVALSFTHGLFSNSGRVVVLDAITGETRSETRARASEESGRPDIRYLTNDVRLVTVHGSGGAPLQGYSLDTGRLLWEYQGTEECGILADPPHGHKALAADGGTAYVALLCGEDDGPHAGLLVAGIEAETGEQVWRTPLGAGTQEGRRVNLYAWDRIADADPQKDAIANLFSTAPGGDFLFLNSGSGDLWEPTALGYAEAIGAFPPSGSNEERTLNIVVGNVPKVDRRVTLRTANALLEHPGNGLQPDDFPAHITLEDPDGNRYIPESAYKWPNTDMHQSATEEIKSIIDSRINGE